MSSETRIAARGSDERLGFVGLPLTFFRRATAPALDVYGSIVSDQSPKLLASRKQRLTRDQLDALQRRGHHELLVPQNEFHRHATEIVFTLNEIVVDESLPEGCRVAVLQSAVQLEVEKTFPQRDSGPFIALAQRLGRQIAGLVGEGRATPPELFPLVAHDTTMCGHLTNVAAYAVMLGDALGIRGAAERQEIAVGAVLHDLGKRGMPAALLAKSGKLTGHELQLVESHPQRGYEAVHDRSDVTFAQKMMIYQHHEWCDGRGYPVGLVGEDIHDWAKLLAVVDAFDTMTARRPHRQPLSMLVAGQLLAEGIDTQFAREPVQCWNALLRRPSRT